MDIVEKLTEPLLESTKETSKAPRNLINMGKGGGSQFKFSKPVRPLIKADVSVGSMSHSIVNILSR